MEWNTNLSYSFDSSSSIVTLIIGDSVKTVYDNFKNFTQLQNITIGKSVTAIRAQAFGDCSKLQTVTSYAKEPPYCYPNVFQNKPSTAVLKVYASCADAYRQADQWKDFTIETMADPRDEMLATLESVYTEYSGYTFKAGTEEGQYGKEEVKAFNAAKYKASEILTSPEDYTDEEIQATLDNLQATYQAVLASKVEGYTLTDGTELAITDTKTYNMFTYTRTYPDTNWQALYVPFSLKYEDWADNYEIADINMFHQYDTDGYNVPDMTDLEVFIVDKDSILPNTPYLIRAKVAGEQSIQVSNVTLYPTESCVFTCNSMKATYSFTGTYSALTQTDCYTLQNGELVQTSSADIQPQRWYLTVAARGTAKLSMPAKIRIRTTDEIINGVEEIADYVENDKTIYNLAGQRISRLQKGINIVGGRKVLCK